MKTNSINEEYLHSIKINFEKYKAMGDKTFAQLEEKDFHYSPDEESNTIAVIIQHVSGNLISRFTDFLTSDGEKQTRNRDMEFEEQQLTQTELIKKWNDSWKVLLDTLNNLTNEDLSKTIYIRKEAHSIVDALNRSLTHTAYHIGQIVYLAKHIRKNSWKTLSIPKGKSVEFNKSMEAKKK
ncbi:MAG: DUF1572 family protein [Ignavibacteriaceae bacterium]|jgi:hypothetical protein